MQQPFFQVSVADEGMRGLVRGWAPTAIGYSMQVNYNSTFYENIYLNSLFKYQGVCKFGFYEVFKIVYANALGEENAYVYRTGLYLAASASAEFFADIALSPMEAVKVRIQNMPGFPATLRAGVPIIMK